MNKVCLSIDIGSKNIVISNIDSNIILNEPSVVVSSKQNNKFVNVACGYEALKYLSVNPTSQTIYPIKNGAIDNANVFIYMLKAFVARVAPSGFFKNYINAIVNVSCGLTNLEKRVIEDSCYKAGIKEVTIVESPISVKAMNNDAAMMVVDIGSSVTEIAIVSDDGIVNGCSINVGGDDIDYAIVDYISDKYKLIINKDNSENIKLGLVTLFDDDMETITIKGRAVLKNTKSEVKLTASELKPLAEEVIDKIAEVVEAISLMIPNSFASCILQNGFYLCGGGSKLPGLKDYLSNKLHIDIKIIDEPEFVVAKGGSKFFYDKGKLARMLRVANFNNNNAPNAKKSIFNK